MCSSQSEHTGPPALLVVKDQNQVWDNIFMRTMSNFHFETTELIWQIEHLVDWIQQICYSQAKDLGTQSLGQMLTNAKPKKQLWWMTTWRCKACLHHHLFCFISCNSSEYKDVIQTLYDQKVTQGLLLQWPMLVQDKRHNCHLFFTPFPLFFIGCYPRGRC